MKLPVYNMKGVQTSLKLSNARELCKRYFEILMAAASKCIVLKCPDFWDRICVIVNIYETSIHVP